MSNRTYKIQKISGSYYVCIPPTIVTELMLKHGVKIRIIHKDISKDEAVIVIRADVNGKHNKANKTSRKDS